MQHTLEIGDAVEYVDEFGVAHSALVTQNWGSATFEADPEQPWLCPSINVVYVAGDESQTDSYGRQIARQTSVVHELNQQAHGRYYRVK